MCRTVNLIDIRRDLHQIPEQGFKEFETQAYLLNQLQGLKNERLTLEKWRTGILVFIEGFAPTKTTAYRADIDGLPIKEETGLAFHSKHPEMMHACGHDFHMTIALGLIESLIKKPVKENVLVIFQPAEEGPGGAKPLMESEVFQKYKVDEIFGLHIAPDLPVGTVSTKAGLLFANTSELFIDFKGKGGHAAYPHLTEDMAVAASHFLVQMQQIVSRRIDPIESAVVTIGKMTAGSVQNIIAETARLEGTIRTTDPKVIDLIKQEIERLAGGFQLSHHCEITIDYGSNYYQVSNNEAYVEAFEKVIERSSYTFKQAEQAMTGEDFGYFLKDINGFMFWLGVNSEFGLHHAKLKPDEAALAVGVEVVDSMIRMMTE